ncbi:MAG TPA: outer membrane lipoprotein carrier protein LolA [Stellaceae bacterium]|jgi:outer membrane lipoprotein-sorting protein
MLKRREFVKIAAAIAITAALPRLARAAAPVAAKLDDAAKADVARIVAYLNGIHTLESHIEQVAADGSDSTGMLYVERPGKLRLQYDPPLPVMIIADGAGIYYWDSKLEQLSETRVEDTPAWFLLRPDIKAVGDVTVTKFDRQPGVLRMTMVETRHADLGSVTLTLTDNPMQLRQWTVVDAQARPVTVTLTDPRFGMAISPLMFQWIDPRMTKGRIPG